MLAGDLSEFGLEDLCGLVASTGKSGALRVTTDGGEGRVHFADGQVVLALADDRRLPLAARLVGAGHLSAERVEALVAERAGDGAAQVAAALLSQEDLDDDVVETFVAEQVHEALFHLLRLEEGAFTFEPGDGEAWPGPRLGAHGSIAEARRRLEEWRTVAEHLPDEEAVLALVPNPPGEGAISLERAQWQLLALVDGQRSLADLAELAGTDAFTAGKLASELVERGLVELAGEGGAIAGLLEGREALRRLEEVALGGAGEGSDDDAEAPARGAIAEASRASAERIPGVPAAEQSWAAAEGGGDAERGDPADAVPGSAVSAQAEPADSAEPEAAPVASAVSAGDGGEAEETAEGLAWPEDVDDAAPWQEPEEGWPDPERARQAGRAVDDGAGDEEIEAEPAGVSIAPVRDGVVRAVADAADGTLAPDESGGPGEEPDGADASAGSEEPEEPEGEEAEAVAAVGVGLGADGDVNRGLLLRLIDGVKGA